MGERVGTSSIGERVTICMEVELGMKAEDTGYPHTIPATRMMEKTRLITWGGLNMSSVVEDRVLWEEGPQLWEARQGDKVLCHTLCHTVQILTKILLTVVLRHTLRQGWMKNLVMAEEYTFRLPLTAPKEDEW